MQQTHTTTLNSNAMGNHVSGVKRHEPNEETKAAILEGDELARAYCARFDKNEDTSAKE